MQQLAQLGLSEAVSQLQRREEACEKWALAYAHYKFVTPEQVQVFRDKCTQEYRTSERGYRVEKRLVFTPIKDYPSVPPTEALTALQEAQARKVFDGFEIAHIEWQEIIPDPILFGCITGCPDKFVIAEWGTDVSYADLVGK